MVCIIPAKGFSRRVPQKNIKDFCGKPLLAWSIIQARCSKLITDVYVSTESREVAAIAESYGAKIIWRDYKDTHETNGGKPILRAMQFLQRGDNIGEEFVNMFCTSPLRKPGDIDNVIRTFHRTKANQALMFGEIDELVIYKKCGKELVRPYLSDFWRNYTMGTNSTSVCSTAWYEKQYKFMKKTSGETDTGNREAHRGFANKLRRKIFNRRSPLTIYPCEFWQTYEADTPTDFKLCEFLMETNILKGQGAEVYKKYAMEEE